MGLPYSRLRFIFLCFVFHFIKYTVESNLIRQSSDLQCIRGTDRDRECVRYNKGKEKSKVIVIRPTIMLARKTNLKPAQTHSNDVSDCRGEMHDVRVSCRAFLPEHKYFYFGRCCWVNAKDYLGLYAILYIYDFA